MCVSKTKSYYPNEIIVGAPGEDLESSDQDEAGWMYSYEIFNRRYVPLYGFGQSFVAKDNDGGDQFGSAMAVCHSANARDFLFGGFPREDAELSKASSTSALFLSWVV